MRPAWYQTPAGTGRILANLNLRACLWCRHPGATSLTAPPLAAAHLTERLDIPHVQALTVPVLTPTRAFPMPGMFRHDLGGLLNRESYRLAGALSRPYAGLIRGWRSDRLNLAPRGKPPAPAKTLYCYSPSLVPTPADWPAGTVAAGYWLRDHRDDAAPADLTWRALWPPGRHRSMSASAAASDQIPLASARRSAARCGRPASAR
jgi:hypothetical protein